MVLWVVVCLLRQAYFAQTDERKVRDELKLNRADVGWYQIRKALQARNARADFPPVSFKVHKLVKLNPVELT